MQYLKLGHVTTMVSEGEMSSAELLSAIASGTVLVVNVKGLVLTSAQVSSHLSGGVDGDTLTRTSANVWPE